MFFVRYANKILAATTDCNSLYCALDPREGGKIAVAEAARNLTCSGARPLAVTDCLNFGNPYKPENFWQLREAVEGVAEACRAFGTPVTGGNVSLYNESPLGVVDPTPTIAMVGLIDDEKHITTQWFKDEGDVIILVGVERPPLGRTQRDEDVAAPSLGGSRYLKVCHGLKIGPPPHVDLAHEIKVQNAVRDLIREGLVQSAHDCSRRRTCRDTCRILFQSRTACSERRYCSRRPAGDAPAQQTDQTDASHSEAATVSLTNRSRASSSRSRRKTSTTQSRSYASMTFHFSSLGKVGGDELQIRIDEQTFRWRVAEIYDDWWNAIRRAVEQDESIPSL